MDEDFLSYVDHEKKREDMKWIMSEKTKIFFTIKFI